MNLPNIVYIHSHDTGRWIQPHGYAVDTPNLQRLAGEGVLFRKAFCVAPTCSPSRAGLLTGMAPHCNGMLGLAHLGWKLNDYGQHLIQTLHRAGYTSALCGIQHIAPFEQPQKIGYKEILPLEGLAGEEITSRTVEYLHREHKKPFFLSVGFFETHREFSGNDPRDDPRYTAVPPPLPDTPGNRADMARFKTDARILDGNIGRVLAALDTSGLAENTLVIATTDHGLAMPAMKCHLTDHGTGVYLILRGPSGLSGGKVCDAMVTHLDIFPTVCELLGIESPEWLQGRSLLPLVQGLQEEIHDEIFAEVTYHASYEPQRAIRTHRWKYIRRFDSKFRNPVLTNCDDCPPKSLWLDKTEWRTQSLPEERLYDLVLDPQEGNNLAGQPEMLEVLKDLRARLHGWMARTGDPLLSGDVPLPQDGLMWPQDAVYLEKEQMVGPEGIAPGSRA